MITASESLTKVIYENSSIRIGAGCTLEYNMNSLLDNISIDYDNAIESGYLIDGTTINPFKKLFPIDSIAKPFRPTESGVKYYIMWDADLNAHTYSEFNSFPYPKSTQPRMYYPAVTNFYKYWVTPVNSTFNITARYIQSSATISEAYSTGPNAPYPNRVVYTTTAKHGFAAGQTVTIAGGTALNSANLSSGVISSILSPTQFLIEDPVAVATSTGGTATLSTPTKAALANKLVIRYEKYHKIPDNCTVKITYSDNTHTGDLPFSSASYLDGNLILYWNGTSWTTSLPYSSSQPISWPNPKEIKEINLKTTTPSGAERIYGIIEISPRWVKDISQDIINFDIQKESTITEDSILPVGSITANSMQVNLAKYNQTNIRVLPYNRQDAWTTTPTVNEVIYLYKDIEVTPYTNLYHANGAVTDGSDKYDRIKQGTFYIDTYNIGTYGDTEISALDGAKYLMQTIPVDLHLQDAPATSVLMSLLDTIGFTNYNFNLETDDTSVPTMRKWWTDNKKTVWDHIQEICRDIQMNAFFDENNVLQFYSRDKLYNKTSIDWNFYQAETVVGAGQSAVTRQPSIIDFSKREIASANQVKIIWRTPMSSLYETSAELLWSSEPTFLIAGGLADTISNTTKAENINFKMLFNNQEITSAFNFSGYLLLNSEIFEYDAIEFKYTLEETGEEKTGWVESKSQWAALRSVSKVDYQYFQPTGRFRIKKRAMFGTQATTHIKTADSVNTNWQLVQDEWEI